jgi:hypothetical protein
MFSKFREWQAEANYRVRIETAAVWEKVDFSLSLSLSLSLHARQITIVMDRLVTAAAHRVIT